VVIPAEIRRTLGLQEGSELVAMVEDDAVVFLRRDSVKPRLRSMFTDVGTSLRDELIAERRTTAAEESRDR
jgi:AbrB family looped-hinge helix DNA binding protein